MTIPKPVLEILKLASNKERTDHREFLDLALRVVLQRAPHTRVKALLWLRDWKKNRVLLDICRSCDDTNPPIEFQMGCADVSGPDNRNADSMTQYKNDLLACELRDKDGKIIRPLKYNLCFELEDRGDCVSIETERSGAAPRLIGFLVVYCAARIERRTVQLLELVALSLSNNLFRQRRRRAFEAITQMLSAPRDSNVDGWFSTAGEALVKATMADACIVFRPAPEQHFVGVVAWSRSKGRDPDPERFRAAPSSLVRKMFEDEAMNGIVRLADFRNRDERMRTFRTEDYDKNLAGVIEDFVGVQRTWMAAPISAHDQILAIVILINKQSNLPKQFSATDEEIVECICRYLSSVLPSVLARRMMEEAVGVESSVLAVLGGNAEDEDKVRLRDYSKIFSVLQNTIPIVSGATLWVARDDKGESQRLIHLGGKADLMTRPSLLTVPTPSVETFSSGTKGTEKLHYFVLPVEGLRDSIARLGILVTIPRVTDHEVKMLTLFVRAALSAQLRAREVFEMQMRLVVEIRHNIRAGLNGLAHLGVAMNLFDVFHRWEYRAPANMLRKAHKSIKSAYHYSEVTRVLMEQSTFQLVDIGRKNLRVRKVALGEVAREVIRALQIDADNYGVTVTLENAIARNEEVEVDRNLIYLLFFNLVDNAIKYSREKERVHVRLSLGKGKWYFEVENVGAFICEDALSEIFRPFVRKFDGGLRRARPGTGLGLPTVKAIVNAHGGTIDVQSILHPHPRFDVTSAANKFKVSMPRYIR